MTNFVTHPVNKETVPSSRSLPTKYLSLAIVAGIILLIFLALYLLSASVLVYFSTAWFVIVSLALWLGNSFITSQLDRNFSWLTYGNIRFFVQLVIGIVYTLLVINGSYFAIKYSLTPDPPTSEQIIVMNVYGAVIFIPIYSIYFSLQFLQHWRKSELASERYQKESIRAQLESLKDHFDPHFLFNNLNILSSLVEKDKKLSQKFIETFGEVYRAMLRKREEDLISLQDELEFIESYIFLVKMRFGENIKFDIAISDELRKLRLPPLTLQLLVENAIKHNYITEKRPLQIVITTDQNNSLVVRNTLFEKNDAEGNSNGTGLATIVKRYHYFTEKNVEIIKNESEFSVRIPLLEIENL